ncbi:MAG: hypothetical protein MI810_20155 [Flavobacteriales bacterium]|nr:hypothetical protein [Flavobacteriales bacterium]
MSVLRLSLLPFILLVGQAAFAQKIVEQDGKYGLLNAKWETVLPLEYDTIYNLLSYRKTTHSNPNYREPFEFYAFKKNGQLGYAVHYIRKFDNYGIHVSNPHWAETDHWEIAQTQYDKIYLDPDHLNRKSKSKENRLRSTLLTEKDGKMGAILVYWAYGTNLDSQSDMHLGIRSLTVIPPIYDKLIPQEYPILIKDKQYGIFFSEKEQIEPQYDSIKRWHSSSHYYRAWKGKNCGILKKKQLIFPAIYPQEVYHFNASEGTATIFQKGKPFTIFNVEDSSFHQFRRNGKALMNNPDSIFYSLRYIYAQDKSKKFDLIQTIFFPDSTYGTYSSLADQLFIFDHQSRDLVQEYAQMGKKYFYNGLFIIEFEKIKPNFFNVRILETESSKEICFLKKVSLNEEEFIFEIFSEEGILHVWGNNEDELEVLLGLIDPKTHIFYPNYRKWRKSKK